MANFDAAAGVTLAACNSLLGEYYKDPPANMDPFTGDVTQNIPVVGSVELTWEIEVAPTITFGPPALADWNAALDSQGQTNASASHPLPSGNMLQLCIPLMQAHYTLGKSKPVGGETANVYGYATVTFSGSDITITLVAIKLNESDFSGWDKIIFNSFFIPQIFKAVQSMLSVIHIPNLTYQGVTLSTPQFFFVNNALLVAACTDSNNKQALDVSGVTWPAVPMFVLLSPLLINDALAAFSQSLVGKSYSGSGVFHALGSDLADYNYDAKLTSISASWTATAPQAVTAAVTASPSFGGSLTAAGMALAVTVGCALCSGQGQMQAGPWMRSP